MSNFLTGINNFLQIIIDNWTTIIAIFAALFLIYKRVMSFFAKSEEDRIAFARDMITKTMLEYVSSAEKDYAEWVKAGATKRAQVIAQIFADFPVLAKVTDQDALIAWIDETIKEALKEMRLMIQEKAE